MTDDRLRELERRFQATGAPEDEGAWLRAQMRAGLISEKELRLRAYDKDEAARLALGDWKNDNAWFEALKEKQDREAAERLTAARAEAAERGKEPFDIEAFSQVYDNRYGPENPQRYAKNYEYEYYVTWTRIMTLVEFAEHRQELDLWG